MKPPHQEVDFCIYIGTQPVGEAKTAAAATTAAAKLAFWSVLLAALASALGALWWLSPALLLLALGVWLVLALVVRCEFLS